MPYESGDGTSGNPFIITAKEHYDTVPEFPTAGTHWRFEAHVDYEGASLRRLYYLQGGGGIDFNGYRLFNVGNLTSGYWINVIEGDDGAGNKSYIINGGIEINSTYAGETSVIRNQNGRVENFDFDGSLTDSGSTSAGVYHINGNNADNINVKMNMSLSTGGNSGAWTFGNDYTVTNLIAILDITATGTVNMFRGTGASVITNMLYDSDVAPGGVTSSYGTGVTTANLQSLSYYTGLGTPFDMVALGSYVDEEWAIDDGNAYPVLGWSVEPAPSASIVQPVTITINSSS